MILKVRAVSFFWGFAEATFFFLVPDIWLTRIALSDTKEALINALIALAGAMLGGALLYSLGAAFFDELRQLLNYVPAISDRMIDRVGVSVQEDGVFHALMSAGFTGQPFKIYAAWAGHLTLSPLSFFLAGLIARLSRFVAVILVAWGARSVVGTFVNEQQLYGLHAGLWIAFYIFYFYLMMPW